MTVFAYFADSLDEKKYFVFFNIGELKCGHSHTPVPLEVFVMVSLIDTSEWAISIVMAH